MTSFLTRFDESVLGYGQFDAQNDDFADIVNFTSATYVESELNEPAHKEEVGYQVSRVKKEEGTSWVDYYTNIDSEPPTFDARDFRGYLEEQDILSDYTVFEEPQFKVSSVTEDDQLIARMAALVEPDQCDKPTSNASNSIEASPASEPEHSEPESLHCKESNFENIGSLHLEPKSLSFKFVPSKPRSPLRNAGPSCFGFETPASKHGHRGLQSPFINIGPSHFEREISAPEHVPRELESLFSTPGPSNFASKSPASESPSEPERSFKNIGPSYFESKSRPLDASSTPKVSKYVRFQDNFPGDSAPPSPSLASDMNRFSPFEPLVGLSEFGIDPELLTLKDIPERPWLNGISLAEMNSWQRDLLMQAFEPVGSEAKEEPKLGKKEHAVEERSIDPDLYGKNGTSLTGGANLLCHPTYGICKESMAETATLSCTLIPETFGDKARVVSKPDLRMNEDVERRLLKAQRQRRSPKFGVCVSVPDPEYTKKALSPSNCLFMNFRVKTIKTPTKLPKSR